MAVTVFTAVAFATFLFENYYLVSFHEGFHNLTVHFSAGHGRHTYTYGTVSINEKHFVETHFVALFNIRAKMVDIQVLACFSLKLLSLNLYNCVHLICCSY